MPDAGGEFGGVGKLCKLGKFAGDFDGAHSAT
jgi:hypothetical protein